MRRCASVSPRQPSWLASGLVFDSTRAKSRAKRKQTARCNIANASWVSRFGMFEARVLLEFCAISLTFSQNANPTHSVIRALLISYSQITSFLPINLGLSQDVPRMKQYSN